MGGPGPVYVGSRVTIAWVGYDGLGPVYVGSRVRKVYGWCRVAYNGICLGVGCGF